MPSHTYISNQSTVVRESRYQNVHKKCSLSQENGNFKTQSGPK